MNVLLQWVFKLIQASWLYYLAQILITSSLLAIFGKRWAWLGAGALGVFTIMTILVIHHFWTFTGEKYDIHSGVFLDHLTLIGGLILSAIASVLKYHSQTLSNIFNKGNVR